MMKRILAFACALFAVATVAAHAQGGCDQLCLPNGTPVTCVLGPGGTKTYVDAAGNTYPASTNGTGTFTAQPCNITPCGAVLSPSSININSVAGPLGTITTTLDPTRISTNATITPNTPNSTFPATERFSFYANATLSTRPGRLYRSIQEVSFISQNVNSFNPHRNERFTLAKRVDFEDVNAPGLIAFSLTNVTITLN